MSKPKNLKRKRRAVEATKSDNNGTVPAPNRSSDDPKSVQAVVIEEELEITVDTLQTISKYPNLIKSKACKDLRVAVYDFRQACTTGVNTAGKEIWQTLLPVTKREQKMRISRHVLQLPLLTPNSRTLLCSSRKCIYERSRQSWGHCVDGSEISMS
jgi:hypothetical protein